MANYDIKHPAEFTQEIRKLTTEDRGHADTFNAIYGPLLNNDVYLYEKADAARKHMDSAELHVTAEDKERWNAKAEAGLATDTEAGLLSPEEKKKLATVEENAEENQNAYGKVKVGSSVLTSIGKTGQLELVAGENITLTGDNATQQVVISTKGGGAVISAVEPELKTVLWIDMASGGVLKYYNGTDAWIPVKAVWGEDPAVEVPAKPEPPESGSGGDGNA